MYLRETTTNIASGVLLCRLFTLSDILLTNQDIFGLKLQKYRSKEATIAWVCDDIAYATQGRRKIAGWLAFPTHFHTLGRKCR